MGTFISRALDSQTVSGKTYEEINNAFAPRIPKPRKAY